MGGKKGNKLTLWLFGSSGIVESGQKGEGNVADLCNLSGNSAQLRLEGIFARKQQFLPLFDVLTWLLQLYSVPAPLFPIP